jgi:hypothetical protein
VQAHREGIKRVGYRQFGAKVNQGKNLTELVSCLRCLAAGQDGTGGLPFVLASQMNRGTMEANVVHE